MTLWMNCNPFWTIVGESRDTRTHGISTSLCSARADQTFSDSSGHGYWRTHGLRSLAE
jgi:hypothetical protein